MGFRARAKVIELGWSVLQADFATKATHPRCSNGGNPFVTRLDYKDPLSAWRVMLIKSSTPYSKLA